MERNTRQSVYAGFTLAELLVVVTILALLVSLLLPTFGRAKDFARRTADKATIAGLDRACETFAQENNGNYPSSTPVLVTRNAQTFNLNGAALLFDQLARNVIVDANGNVIVDPSNSLGLRTGRSRADMYEVGSFKTVQMITGAGVKLDAFFFVDSYGNPILYYSLCTDAIFAAAQTERYWDEHNPLDNANKIVPPAAIDLPRQVTLPYPALQPAPLPPTVGAPYSMRWNYDKPAYEYYRGRTNSNNGRNFILISPGKDRKYVTASANPAPAEVSKGPAFKFYPNTDDVTNLSR
jgi:prepilin-type N-terminal cleavage/methylation domain-containing protein